MRYLVLTLALGLVACAEGSNKSVSCADVVVDVPSGRGEVEGVWDAPRGRLVFFGGNQAVPVECSPGATDFVGETWAFKPTCDGFVRVETATAPTVRGRHTASLDQDQDRMIIHGGRFRSGGSGPYTLYGDAWALDLKTDTWSQLSNGADGPSARSNHAAEIAQGQLWVFGGNDSADGAVFNPRNDLWSLDLESGTWEKRTTTNKPPKRLYHSMATDGDRLYVYGGGDENALFGSFFRDVWVLDLATLAWSELHSGDGDAPLGRIWAPMEYDAENHRLVVFGGHDDGVLGNNNELWTFDLTGNFWTRLSAGDEHNAPANGVCDFPPDFTMIDDASPERRNAGVSAVTPEGELVIFGGKTDCGNANDVWALDMAGESWSEWFRATEGEVCLRASQECREMCF